MEPRRLQLRGATLLELRERIVREHGDDAIIVAAERVTVGGIRGFFAKQYYEVTVELPPERRRAAHALDMPARLGIAALLDDADSADNTDDVTGRRHAGAPEQQLSTESPGFAALMDELTYATARPDTADDDPFADPLADPLAGPPAGPVSWGARPPAAAPGAHSRFGAPAAAPSSENRPVPAVPAVLSGAGDLVVIVALTDAALSVAQTFIVRAGDGALRAGGGLAAPQLDRVDDSRTALAARARGVERGHCVFVAFGLMRAGADFSVDFGAVAGTGSGSGGAGDALSAAPAVRVTAQVTAEVTAQVTALAALRADQIWVVADAGRKSDDTRRWVQAVAASVSVAGIVGIGAELTQTPNTLEALGLPVLWESNAPAPAPLTRRQVRGYPSGIDSAG